MMTKPLEEADFSETRQDSALHGWQAKHGIYEVGIKLCHSGVDVVINFRDGHPAFVHIPDSEPQLTDRDEQQGIVIANALIMEHDLGIGSSS